MSKRIKIISRIFFIISGICFVCIGIANSQYVDVLQKAIKVCLECIGIG